MANTTCLVSVVLFLVVIMFDTELFICEVEMRPPLYDVTSKEYSNREIKAKCWAEVCEVMFNDWVEMDPDQKDAKGEDKLFLFFSFVFNLL